MTETLKIALAQLNPTVGDIAGNLALIRAARAGAAEGGADLVVASELFLSGYPPEDLVLKPHFLEELRGALEALAEETGDGGPAVILGCPWLDKESLKAAPGAQLRHHVSNAAFLLDGGKIQAMRAKYDLPNYSVFDEVRIFKPGPLPGPVNCRGVRLGLMVCEDMWSQDVSECLEESGAEILVVINGSPYESDKAGERLQLAAARVAETGLPLLYVNQVGGQDELVFDGASFALGAQCNLRVLLPMFETAQSLTTWTRSESAETNSGFSWGVAEGAQTPPLDGPAAVYGALVLGLRDYVNKNGFPSVVLGLSGGIDSALSAAVAVDALGSERVHGVMMPSPYSSQGSLDDGAETGSLLGIKVDTVSIEPAMTAFAEMLGPVIGAGEEPGHLGGVTEENIQARARGVTLMAVSNKTGAMVLSTGNKSELSVGYATLYGDMCGGYNALKDVYKTDVFALARWRNENFPRGALGPQGRAVPENSITKPPSAELRPDQTDQDSLPPYDDLDSILKGLIEEELSVHDIAARGGYDPDLVNRVWRLLELSEYKRRQAAPGVKTTRRNLSRDRRYPITNAFKGPA